VSKTRKELLEDMSGDVQDLSRAIEDHSTSFTVNGVEVHSPDILGASSQLDDGLRAHGKSMESAADSLVGAVALGIGGLISAALVNGVVQAALQTREANEAVLLEMARLIQILESLENLIERKGRISFDEAVKKTYATGTTTEDRITLINNLIHQQYVVEVEEIDEEDFLLVDKGSEDYEEFWTRVEAIKQALLPNPDEENEQA